MAKLERITVRVIQPGTEQPAQGAAVLLRVKVPKKNSYTVGPKIVGPDGEVVFARDEIEGEISLYKTISPMDYQSDLVDAIAFEAQVMDVHAIDSLFNAQKIWGASIPECRISDEEENQLIASRAQQWEPSKGAIAIEGLREFPQSLQFDLCTASKGSEQSLS